jgi:hypothetical protein
MRVEAVEVGWIAEIRDFEYTTQRLGHIRCGMTDQFRRPFPSLLFGQQPILSQRHEPHGG